MNDILPSRSAIDGDIDLLVVGSGASGLAAAITAKRLGLNTVIIEKCPVWGGSTAVSSGGIWAPLNSFAKRASMPDDIEQVRIYLDQTAPRRNPQLSELFLRWVGPALDFLEDNSAARFVAAPKYPDYDSEKPGSSMEGRMLWPLPYDGRALGEHFQTLRPPLQHSMLFGGMVVGVAELKIFMRAYRSPKAAWHVFKRIARYAKDRASVSRGYDIANGNALAGRLGQTVFDLNIPLHLSTSLQRLIEEDGRVVGAVVQHNGKERTILARSGVVLAAGGAAASIEWQQRIYSHVKAGIEHHSLVPPGATGDSLRLAGQLAGDADLDPAQPVVWLPISLVPIGNGKTAPFPSFIDRAKPGFIAVDPGGQRFTNEASSYQEFVPSFLTAAQAYGADKGYTWLIASHAAVRKYGIGAARPFPFRLSPHLKSGYVVSGHTPEELAAKIGVPAHALAATIQRYNENARNGVDPDFGRGTLSYNRHMGDPEHRPNPCVAPLDGRLYAIKLLPGDAGTTFGLKVDENMQVLRTDGSAIAGLYAVGNDIASIFGGGYPGGGATLGPALAFGHLAGRVAAGADRLAHR